MPSLIALDHLSKRYPQAAAPAVDDLSFAVEAGEIFSLLGPNGAGKSTTIAMLCGLLAPTGGDATIAGHSVVAQTMAVKRLIGVVPQEIALYPELSARQNLRFWGEMYDLTGKPLATRIEELLEQVGLRERGNDRIETYSGGMKRRINIAAGLIHRPQILFMDEPTVGIDPQSRRAILDLTKELNRGGMTLLYTTHYMEEAQELSDRIGIMDQGKLIALGSFAELTTLVGDESAIHLTVHGASPELAAALGRSAGVRAVEVGEEGRMRLLVASAEEALPGVLAAVQQHGGRLTSVNVESPNLESLFLQLTGRRLRD
jgi:ABC-2 type transport system ATP-binding protein